jgi:glycosyltransferase involved in cell wall biosynthesis
VRVGFVVQRYGNEVCGGSEFLCRLVAERMRRHWDLEVLTSCAVDHFSWRNEYPAGLDAVNGVPVRRFPVDFTRDLESFHVLSAQVYSGTGSEAEELDWMRLQGPYSTAFNDYIRAHADDYDLLVFFTYLYAFTFYGLPVAPAKSVLVPTAHDEPPIYLGIFRRIMTAPRALVFLTPQEQDFVNGLFGTHDVPQDVLGVGVEAPADVDPRRFLARHADRLEGADVVLYLGRIEWAKGCYPLFNNFMRFRHEAPQHRAKLVLLGSSSVDIPPHPDIVHLGFVSEQEKWDALAAARVVVLSSPFESLSLAALEAWKMGTPVLANGACEVLRGQCIRTDGGLWYESYPQFREALAMLLGDAALRRRLGESGRAFVDSHYEWPAMEARYLRLMDPAGRAEGRDVA